MPFPSNYTYHFWTIARSIKVCLTVDIICHASIELFCPRAHATVLVIDMSLYESMHWLVSGLISLADAGLS